MTKRRRADTMSAMIRRLIVHLVNCTPGPLKAWINRHGNLRQRLSACYQWFTSHGGRAVPVRIRRGPLEGMRIHVDDTTPAHIWMGDEYEAHAVRTLRNAAPRGAVVADVGANIGYFTLLLAQCVGPDGCVLGFEPDPNTYARLSRNIQLNDLPQVKTFDVALSDRDGQTMFAATSHSEFGRVIEGNVSDAGNEQVTIATAVGGEASAALIGVRCVRLDALLSEQQLADPTLLKIDVEGHEAAVLRGATELLRRARPTLLIEAHGPEPLRECVRLLKPMGYDIRSMPHNAGRQRVIEEAINGQTIEFEGFERMYVLCRAASDAHS